MYKILIVEDEPEIAKNLKKHFETWGYEVGLAQDFRRISEEVLAFAPDLILLDILLPFYDGFYWCRKLREFTSVPVIFLSSASDNLNIVMAMNMGGDDFIAKPFDLGVLTAKVQALLRRSYEVSVKTYLEHDGAVLNSDEQILVYDGREIALTKNEYKILQALMEKKGIVNREALMERLWKSESFIDENTLTVNITRLRRKLEENGLEDFIKTKHGVGYYLR